MIEPKSFGASVWQRLASPALVAYAVTGAAAASSAVSGIIIARFAGAETLGHYALGISTAQLLSTFALFGLDRIGLREVAGDLESGLGGRARASLWGMTRFVALVALSVAALYVALTIAVPNLIGGDRNTMLAAALGILVWPLMKMASGGLRGSGSPIFGQICDSAGICLFAFVILSLAIARVPLSGGLAILLFFIMNGLSAGFGWAKLIARARHWGPPAAARDVAYSRAGLMIMAISFMHIVADWSLLLQISTTGSAAATGVFRAAYQIITIGTLIVTTSENFVSGPIAADVRAGRLDLAWRRHRRATWLMLAMGGPPLLALILLPEPIVAFVYGPEFAGAALPLAIMAFGQLCNLFAGPIGSIIIMSGNERLQIWITIASLGILAICLLTLVPWYGPAGAATAVSAMIAFRAAANVFVARRYVSPPRTP